MIENEYLELIQFTQLLLLQNSPKKLEIAKSSPLPSSQPPPSPTFSPPKTFKASKTEPAPLSSSLQKPVMTVLPEAAKDPAIIKGNQDADFKEILDLLNQHCPHIRLRKSTEACQKKILVVFGSEDEQEQKLLENLSLAISKEGFPTSFYPKKGLEQNKNEKILLILSQKTRETLTHLDIKETTCFVIPDLAALLKTPSMRHDLWKSLLNFLKSQQ